MIRLITYRVGISPKLMIQKIVDMLSIQNGQIIVKVQNGKFIHLSIQPSFTPVELDATEAEISELK